MTELMAKVAKPEQHTLEAPGSGEERHCTAGHYKTSSYGATMSHYFQEQET